MQRKNNLTSDERNGIVQFLISNHTNGAVHKGKIKEAASIFKVSSRSVHKYWAIAKAQLTQGIPIMITNKMQGIPHKKFIELDEEKMLGIPVENRGTIRKLAKELGVSKTQVGRWVKEKAIKAHTNAIHPQLTESNKHQRLQYALNAVVQNFDTKKLNFSGMYNVVHIDEKWFYMTQEMQRMYKLPNEVTPYRSCKSKRFITKVMFMCAVARPQFASDGSLTFDGKIGLFPFTKQQPAARKSKNRPRGTLETKAIESITKEVIRDCLVNQIIPAIKAKWPQDASKVIFIQQDNARPHINNSDLEFMAAANSDGFSIRLLCQPPNSPDTNINDLGWFRAIQSLQLDTPSRTVDQLVKNVLLSFGNLTAITLNNVFLSLQGCLIEVMKAKGHNDYKVPHMSKARLLRQDKLPEVLEVDEGLVRECIQFLIEENQIDGIGGLMSVLGYVA